MKFLVTRTSVWFIDELTDEELYKKLKLPQGFKYSTGNYVNLLNKKNERGCFVEINTFEEFLDFVDKAEEKVIVKRALFNEQIRELEIYDTWRE